MFGRCRCGFGIGRADLGFVRPCTEEDGGRGLMLSARGGDVMLILLINSQHDNYLQRGPPRALEDGPRNGCELCHGN